MKRCREARAHSGCWGKERSQNESDHIHGTSLWRLLTTYFLYVWSDNSCSLRFHTACHRVSSESSQPHFYCYLHMGKKKHVLGVSRTVTVSKGVSSGTSGLRVGLQNVKRKIGPAELSNTREESRKRVHLELSGMSMITFLFVCRSPHLSRGW